VYPVDQDVFGIGLQAVDTIALRFREFGQMLINRR
jgi:hypothetical protein